MAQCLAMMKACMRIPMLHSQTLFIGKAALSCQHYLTQGCRIRNMLDGSSSHISAASLANMVHYMRREMHALEKMDGELFLSGYLPWGAFQPPSRLNK